MSNSLVAVHLELITEWSEKNLPLTPDNVTFGSNKKVWWKGACGHEWETSVKARSNGEKCPICSGARVVSGINDLSTLKPELASEWSDRNEKKPTEVTAFANSKAWWKCKTCGYEWNTLISTRSYRVQCGGRGCPESGYRKSQSRAESTDPGRTRYHYELLLLGEPLVGRSTCGKICNNKVEHLPQKRSRAEEAEKHSG